MKLENINKKKIIEKPKPKFPQKYSMFVKDGGKTTITPPSPNSQQPHIISTGTGLAVSKPRRAKFLGVDQPQNGTHL